MGHVINMASNDVHRFDEVCLIIILHNNTTIHIGHTILRFFSCISNSHYCSHLPAIHKTQLDCCALIRIIATVISSTFRIQLLVLKSEVSTCVLCIIILSLTMHAGSD